MANELRLPEQGSPRVSYCEAEQQRWHLVQELSLQLFFSGGHEGSTWTLDSEVMVCSSLFSQLLSVRAGRQGQTRQLLIQSASDISGVLPLGIRNTTQTTGLVNLVVVLKD